MKLKEAEALVESEDDEDEIAAEYFERNPTVRKGRSEQIEKAAGSFLEGDNHEVNVVLQPTFYARLLAWATRTYLCRNDWEAVWEQGLIQNMPIYEKVEYAFGKTEKCVINGMLGVSRGDKKLMLVLNLQPRGEPSVQVISTCDDALLSKEVADGIEHIVATENFYRKAVLRMGYFSPVFIRPEARNWDEVIIDDETRRDIELNTIGFLKQSARLSRMGIPRKRGVILAGHPGTGKTIICKALMARASRKYTCITTDPNFIDEPIYIRGVYALAAALQPAMLFIEDLDQIGQDRSAFPWRGGGSALNTLLEVMDGVENCAGVITVATTNSLDSMDDALIRRPSRFDRIIELPHPDLDKRLNIIESLSRKIRLTPEIRDYIGRRTHYFTPAQIQEVVYTLAIECAQKDRRFRYGTALAVSPEDVDRAIKRLNGFRRSESMGFPCSGKDAGRGLA